MTAPNLRRTVPRAYRHDLKLKILGVDAGEEIAGALQLTIRTSRGEIPVILHAPDSTTRAVVCISGAIGGFDGRRSSMSGSERNCQARTSRSRG